MDKKLNEFNNSRDTINGVGGKEAVFKCFGCKCTPCCTPEVCEKAVLESIKNQLGLGKQLQRPETFTINTEKPSISVKEAIEILCNALREDTTEGSYYYSWQANIAMAFKDEFRRQYPETYAIDVHGVSNEAAKNFLDLLIKE